MVMRPDDFTEKIAGILVARKVISAQEGENLKKSFAESSHDNFTDFLLEEGLVDKENILIALGDYYQVPYFDVEGHFFDHLLVADFPKDVLLRNEVIPLEIEQNVLVVVAADPSNAELLPILGKYAPNDIQCNVGIGLDIQDAIKEFYEKSLTDIDRSDDTYEALEEEEELEEIHQLEEEEENFEQEDEEEEEKQDLI